MLIWDFSSAALGCKSGHSKWPVDAVLHEHLFELYCTQVYCLCSEQDSLVLMINIEALCLAQYDYSDAHRYQQLNIIIEVHPQ